MKRTSKKLTELELKKAQVKDKDYNLSDGDGLYFIVRKNGSKFFRLDFRYGGKRLSMSLGVYPKTSLKEARDKTLEAKKLLENNINPISLKRLNKITEEITLNFVIDKWLEIRKLNSSENTYLTNKRILKNITDKIGNVAIKDIQRQDYIDIILNVQKKGRIETGLRILSLLFKIYQFAVTNGYIEHNVIVDIDKKSTLLKNRETHLPAITEKEEIKQLLKDIYSLEDRFRSHISTIYIFKLIPYVFVRSENIRLMCWDDLDLEKGYWAIPKEKMKMNVDFVCPLPLQAIKLIKEIEPFTRHRSKYVFPSPQKSDRGVSGATLADTLNRLGYQNRHCFHGFRSMFSTIAHELYKEHGFHSDIIEVCLAHKEKNRVKASYNRESRFKYFDEKKELIQWYADWLDKLKD
ncbi:tyrosine-type recombinase/integrase [Aliarcobacter butzleri]|uniref:tyrosine-type recombinase/integrase n=1 Tax=Aliarcobacter butzleri TaxID=28197 RepID=UPI0021B15C64|nr:integrase arm-type DNA-binding domain-containing protein [Aliarcobacter butzleri]MCT7550921.1 tyrosine-type recombinase/integrase [Aliarcobacter butzleri]MCT7559247.1 tyrosine-type recombinase/integrase [Aliarcobacter butzleri]